MNLESSVSVQVRTERQEHLKKVLTSLRVRGTQTNYEMSYFCPGHAEITGYTKGVTASSHVRYNLKQLRNGDAESLKLALAHMMEDGTFEKIARSVNRSERIGESACQPLV